MTKPHDLDAEAAVIGCVLIRGDTAAYSEASFLEPRSFYRHVNGLVWAAIRAVVAAGKPSDLVTVKRRLQEDGNLDEVGVTYFAGLTDGVPRSTNLSHYANEVDRHAWDRRAARALESGGLGAVEAIQRERERLGRAGVAAVAARLIKASDVRPVRVDWLWRKRLAPGQVTALSGMPGAGKSLVAIDVSASITNGYPLPDDPNTDREAADVVWIGHSTEDTADSVIVPRFLAAGGEPERLHILATAVDVTLSQACEAAAAVAPSLVVIDSWAAWGADAAKDSSTEAADRYRAMDKLRASGAAVLAIMHDRKGEAGEDDATVTAVAGSMQTTAKPRTVLRVKGGTLSALKGNIAGRADGLAFMVEGVTMDLHGVTVEDVPRVVWDSQPLPVGFSPVSPDGDGGVNADELLDYLADQSDPPTANAISKALKMDSRRKRETVKRLLALTIDAGRVRQVTVHIGGRERVGFEAIQSNRLQPAATGAGCSEGATGSNRHRSTYTVPVAPVAPDAADSATRPATDRPVALPGVAPEAASAFDGVPCRTGEPETRALVQFPRRAPKPEPETKPGQCEFCHGVGWIVLGDPALDEANLCIACRAAMAAAMTAAMAGGDFTGLAQFGAGGVLHDGGGVTIGFNGPIPARARN